MSTDAGFDQPAFCTKTLEGLILLTKYFVCNDNKDEICALCR